MKKKNFVLLIFYSIMIIPFYGTKFLKDYQLILNGIKLLAALYFTFETFKDYRNFKLSKKNIVLILIVIYLFMTTLLNSLFSLGVFFSLYFLLISNLFLQKKILEQNYLFLDVLCITHNVILLLNFPSIISQLSISEYNRDFLIGGKNTLTLFVIACIFYNYLYSYIKNGKLSIINWFFILMSLVTTLLGGSSTGFIISVTLFFVMIFNKKIKFNNLIFYGSYILIQIILLNSKIIEKIPLLYKFITEFLKKDLTFTHRTLIWDKSILFIRDNFLGYGIGNSLLENIFNYLKINECHNMFLQLMLDGGIISFLLFIFYFILCNKHSKNNDNNHISNFIKYSIFMIFILGLTESITYKIDLWFMLTLLSNTLFLKEGVKK